MQEVAIIGAGELGGAVAHALARSNLVRSIRLIDDTRRVAVGKALDIAQAAPVEGFATAVSGGTDVSMAAGASIIIIADRIDGGEWQGENGLGLLKRLIYTAPGAVVVCAGPSQHEMVDVGVRELKFPRARLFGSAAESLAAAARALVALALDGSPRDIALSVLGLPPAHVVIPWADATIAGLALRRLLGEPERRRLEAQVTALWPPGPYGLAAAATTVVAPDPSTGARLRTAALPVRLDAMGIVEVLSPSLSAVERVALDNAMQI
jgi:malate dehydrogenase